MKKFRWPSQAQVTQAKKRAKTGSIPQLEIVLRGGMGNQFFQWAFGEFVKAKLPVDVVFDSSIVNLGGIHWGEQLSALLPGVKAADIHKRPITKLMSKPAWSIARYYQWFYPRWETLRFQTPQQAIKRLSKGKNARVADPCFFTQEMPTHPEIAEILNDSLARMHRIEEPHTALHIRRGDYFQQWERAILPSAYYELAANKFPRDLPLWLVSDDKEFAETVAVQLREMGMVAKVVSGPDHFYDLAVLATASALLLSTSSYSWWGAYIAQTIKGAEVYYPQPWSPVANFWDKLTENIGWPLPGWVGVPRTEIG